MVQRILIGMAKPKTSADDHFALSDADNLLQATFRVLHRYQMEDMKPGAEHWQADTRWKRPQLVADIRAAWLDIMGADCLLPWHDDYLVYCWVGLRKCGNAHKRSLCEFFDLPVPEKWMSGRETE